MNQYLHSFIKSNDFLLVDLTHILNASRSIRYAKPGYNSDWVYENQFNLLYIYSSDLVQPVFYNIIPGNMREVKAFKQCILKSKLQNVTLIADK